MDNSTTIRSESDRGLFNKNSYLSPNLMKARTCKRYFTYCILMGFNYYYYYCCPVRVDRSFPNNDNDNKDASFPAIRPYIVNNTEYSVLRT